MSSTAQKRASSRPRRHSQSATSSRTHSTPMASPIRPPPPPPPPPPAVDPVAPSSPPSQHPSRDGSLSPENPAPAPPPPPPAGAATTMPPHSPPSDSSPSSPPPAAVDPVAPSSSRSQHPSRDGSLSPENPTPAPPPPPPTGPTTTPPPHSPGDSSPSSPPHPPTSPTPPFPPTTDASPLPRADQKSPPRSPPHPSPAPAPPPPPAPASSEAKSEQEAAESASESGSMTLALALTQTEDSTPPKASSTQASPIGSPQKESAVTIAKLLSGEDPAAAAVAKPAADKVAPPSDPGSLAGADAVTGVGGGGGGGSVGSKRWLLSGGVPEKVRRAELRRAELGFRVSAAVFCLVALSVMAADTTTGWSGDSFRRYNEYRYVLAASVVAFTYSGFQLVAEVHYLVTRRHIIQAPWRSYFNLAMDQVLAYLLLSASSAALSRNGVWMSRFGGDQFTKLIDASASMAFLAFISLGLSSIISAYCVFSLVS